MHINYWSIVADIDSSNAMQFDESSIDDLNETILFVWNDES